MADKDGKAVTDPKLAAPFTVDYKDGAVTKDDKGNSTFNYPLLGQFGHLSSRV